MGINELEKRITELRELEAFLSEINEQAEVIRDSIKAEMNKRGIEELEAGQYIVRYTSILSTRFDTKRFKEKIGEELYKAYTKEVASRRFSIA